VTELIPYLTVPKRDNYTGSYVHFLNSDLASRAASADLPVLLEWVGQAEPDTQYGEDPFHGACAKITFFAFRSLRDAAVRSGFFTLLRSMSRRDGRLFSPDGRDLGSETEYRRIFWEEFLASDEPIRDRIIQSSLRESGLIVSEDFAW